VDPIPSSVPALVTGASSGIGEEFVRQLGARGHALTIVARRGDRLRTLAAEVRKASGVTVSVLTADLETAEGRAAVAERLHRRAPWLLVNNAGFGTHGEVAQLDPAREQAEVSVNVVALHKFTTELLGANVRAGGGGVINVASTASFQPIPYMATYAASKAFVLHFTEALSVELRVSGVRVMALCPGPVSTEFGEVAGNQRAFQMTRPMSVQRCVAIALRAFDRGDVICIPGRLNNAGAIGVRLLPRAVVRQTVGMVFDRFQPDRA
jgi:short-subunit dehydrogenase